MFLPGWPHVATRSPGSNGALPLTPERSAPPTQPRAARIHAGRWCIPTAGDRSCASLTASEPLGGVMPEVFPAPAGRPRSPATLPGFHAGRAPRNKGQRYPADPPTVAEIVAVMRHAGTGLHAARLRALIVVLWRAGLRIHEALALGEGDLDPRRGSVLVRRGKGGRRREVGMDDWAWEHV